jgi:hypothetical protein
VADIVTLILPVSTMLALFLIPTLYLMLERFPRKPEPEMQPPLDDNGKAVVLPQSTPEPTRV